MFSNLHVHTTFGSLLDSILTVDQAVSFAKKNGQPAIAVTDHGTMTSFVNMVKACNKQGIKPVIGSEIYEVDNMNLKNDTKESSQPRYHLILLSRTQKGFQNLLKITSVARTYGFYKKPRIDLKYIKDNNLGEGIICLTACMIGRLSRYLSQGKVQEAEEYIDVLKDTFDEVICELQSHNTPEQAVLNNLIYQFAVSHNLKYTVTTDAHMLTNKLIDSHSMFVEIGEGREVGESYVDCYLQTEEEVYEKLSGQLDRDAIKAAIETTDYIVNSIEDIDYGLNHGNIMPKIDIPEEFNNNHEEYLRHLVYSTFEQKFGDMSKEEQEVRRQRLDMELDVLYYVDYTDYFIMLYMLAKEAKKRKIPLGYSRGSGANCLCLFMLNVTQIDSVRWDLDFSRFANKGRKSLADFDWDISRRRRKEMVEISEELFGKDNVAPIATFNSLSTKVAIRDIGKVLDEKESSPYYKQIPYSLRDEVAKMIPTVKTLNDLGEEEDKELLLKDVLSKNGKLEAVYEKFPLWFKYVMDLEGLPKSMGRHAAGTLITPTPITNYCALCLDSEKNVMIELEMHNAMDDLGLIKMDYLGLETLDIIDDTLKLANITWQDVDINHLNLCDEQVFNDVYKAGNTVGIFQMESAEARKMCVEAQVDGIEPIIVVNAANRPGTKDSFPDYCYNKLNPSDIHVIHDDLREMFKKTNCILLYQEQALQLFRYAGFPEEEVDNARRSIGKKLFEVMQKLESQFKDGLEKKGWSETQRQEMWDLILLQSKYSFNRGHATAYGLLSYLTAYLKVHYSTEYMTALLTSKSDKVNKISSVINECHRLGIEVLPPDINKSGRMFTCDADKKQILFGLLGVKGLGESIVDKIIAGQPYSNLQDFIERVADKTAIITLIKAGGTPSKNKMKTLRNYADSLFERREYKDVSTLPKLSVLKEKYDIDTDIVKDKEERLRLYNNRKRQEYNELQTERYNKHMNEFKEKYATDEYMWEFDTLSMFLTNDPLKEVNKYNSLHWEDTKDNEKCVVCCVIVDIKRKKDKNGNQFAYLDLYSCDGIIEATIWSRQLKQYSDIVVKGKCVSILGRKREGEHLFVEQMKTYEQWLSDRKLTVS